MMVTGYSYSQKPIEPDYGHKYLKTEDFVVNTSVCC
jgi:hypothetical protein